MRRRYFMAVLTGFAAVISVHATSTKPNFIFFLSDDQDWTETSVQMRLDLPNSKNRYIQTPNLEKLAARGMVFSAAYSPAPVCSPTRISLRSAQIRRLRHRPLWQMAPFGRRPRKAWLR